MGVYYVHGRSDRRGGKAKGKMMIKTEKKEFAEYKIDMAAQAEVDRLEILENERREWAQRNGNDSGFDPYWNLD